MAEPKENSCGVEVGLLALEEGLISAGDLSAAFSKWLPDRKRTFADFLVVNGSITSETRADLEKRLESYAKEDGKPETDKVLDKTSVQLTGEQSFFNRTIEFLRKVIGPTVQPATISDASGNNLPETVLSVSETIGPRPTSANTGQSEPNSPFENDSIVTGKSRPAENSARFQIIRPHRSGGLGEVFLATDTELGREVAIKQIRRDYANSKEKQERLQLEAIITGRLEHPGIVPVYGLGTDVDGRLYYAMRFLGESTLKDEIDKYHFNEERKNPIERSLELRKLLRRFVDICNTLEYAHSRDVIHRDIKPENIGVGNFGETIVLDWGIAKLINRVDFHPSLEPTHTPIAINEYQDVTGTVDGTTVGTPKYMSPEQARGQVSMHREHSDVYCLGSTLFYLITGRPPFLPDETLPSNRQLAAMLFDVIEGRFSKPRAIDRTIDPTLEAICLKAMANAPSSRYPSARAIAEDLERWMADEPASVRPDPPIELIQRWTRKHKTTVTAGMASLIVGMIGVIGIAILTASSNYDLQLANKQIQARFALTQETIRGFHEGLMEDEVLSQPQFREYRNKLIRKALDSYQKLQDLLKDQNDLPSRKLMGDSYYEIGELTAKLEKTTQALTAHRAGMKIRQQLAIETAWSPDFTADLARSEVAIGWLEREIDKRTQTEQHLLHAKNLFELAIEKGRPNNKIRSDLARCLERLGRLYEEPTGKTKEAIQQYQESLKIRDSLFSESETNENKSNLARSYQFLGNSLARSDKQQAVRLLKESQRLRKELVDLEPTNRHYQADLATSHYYLAEFYTYDRMYAKAGEFYEAAAKISKQLVKTFPAINSYQADLAKTLYMYGLTLVRLDRRPEAINNLEESRDILKDLRKIDDTVVSHIEDLAVILTKLEDFRNEPGRQEESLAQFERIRDMQRKVIEGGGKADQLQVSSHRTNLAYTLFKIGSVSGNLGRTRNALDNLKEAVEIQQAVVDKSTKPRDFESLWSYRYGLSKIYGDLGQWKLAAAEYRRAMEVSNPLLEQTSQPNRYTLYSGQAKSSLGSALYESGDVERGIKYCVEALEDLTRLCEKDPHNPTNKSTKLNTIEVLAQTYSDAGRDGLSQKYYEQARDQRSAMRDDEPNNAENRFLLARDKAALATLLARSGKHADALNSLREQKEEFETLVKVEPLLPDYKADLADCITKISLLLAVTGVKEEAVNLAKDAGNRWKELRESYPDLISIQIGESRAQRNLAEIFQLLGKEREAEETVKVAIEIEAAYPGLAVLPALSVEHALTLETKGKIDLDAKKTQKATETLLLASKLLEQLDAPRPMDLLARARVYTRLSGLAKAENDLIKQEDYVTKAMKDLDKLMKQEFQSPGLLKNDKGFSYLESRQDFQALLEKLQ